MKKKTFLVILLTLVIVFVFLLVSTNLFKYRCKYYCKQFSGEITKIKYSTEQYISVELNNNEWYYLGNEVNYTIDIEIGDSIIKRNNSYSTILLKKNKSYDISSNIKMVKLLEKCNCYKP